jgi:tRNA threonylcarbamoyladenosine biosynthesis protein TsaB
MALILNIESATERCSVCLSNGREELGFLETQEAYTHSERLTLLIEEVMKGSGCRFHELSAVAVSSGPGSYTSLRVGVSVAKGICFAVDKPMIAIDTLQATAHAALLNTADFGSVFCAMIDARRMEVYTAFFDSQNQRLSPTQSVILSSDSFDREFLSGRSIVFCGNGAAKCSSVVHHTLARFDFLPVTARDMVQLSLDSYGRHDFYDRASFEPTYFKQPNITQAGKLL